MQFPVYVLSDADQIPLPGGEVYIDIPLGMANRFRSAAAGIGPQGPGLQKVVVVGYNQGNNWALMESAQSLTDLKAHTGIICVVERKEDSDTDQIITLVGQERVHILSFYDTDIGVEADVQPVLEEFSTDEEKLEADVESHVALIINRAKTFDRQVIEMLKRKRNTSSRMHLLAHYFMKPDSEKRLVYLLEMDYAKQWDMVQNAISAYLEQRRSEIKTKKTTRKKRSSKPIIPRENWRARIATSAMPDEHEAKIRDDIKRWEALPDTSSDKHVISHYLDTVLSIPWAEHSAEQANLTTIRQKLDETHHGLDGIKDHVLEHMVIEARCGGSSGTVLCFTGPPGTGKTSIAKSIARATGRKLIRIALGGMKDEAELRGHRRTYVGAKAGRIIDGIRKEKTMDPLILLDEVDKINRFQGDPGSALLELLDPEQNNEFVDRFVELPIDLSKAMFICTANDESLIHDALLDRMEFLEFRKYTYEERRYILENYICPKTLANYNMTAQEVTITPDAMDIIAQEEHLRQIERRTGKILRKAAVRLDVHKEKHVVIDVEDIIAAPNRNTQPIVGFR